MSEHVQKRIESLSRHRRVTSTHPREAQHTLEVPSELLARFFHTLADPTRLRILELLARDGELHVSALVERLGQPQGRVSAHLTCLRTCGLVRVRQEGKYRYYALADHRIPAVVALARDLARPHLAAIAACRIATRHDPPEDAEV